MRRRYNLKRSDNFPLTGTIYHVCSGDGNLFVYTGFPVQSAIAVPQSLPDGAELNTRVDENIDNGFYVEYKRIPGSVGIIHFSFTAQ